MKNTLLLFCLFFFAFSATAQTKPRFHLDSIRLSVGLQMHKGFIIAHRDTLVAPAKGAYPGTLELSFGWLDHSKKGWRKSNCYTQNGIIVGTTNFGKKEVLGNGSYFMFYTEPQLSFNRKINFSITIATGLIRLSEVYNLTDNPTNRFFSNPTSGLMRVGIQASYSIASTIQLQAGLNYNHISNGGTRVPNLGMNYPTGNISLAYHFRPSPFLARKKATDIDSTFHYHLQLFTVSRLVRDWDKDSERKRLAGLSFSISKQFNHLSSWIVGGEFSYDGSLPETGKFFERYDDSPYIVSLTGGHSVTIGRVEFSQVLGLYVFKKYDTTKALFQRYTLLYSLGQHMQVGFSLKSHAEVAELLDVRLGITF